MLYVYNIHTLYVYDIHTCYMYITYICKNIYIHMLSRNYKNPSSFFSMSRKINFSFPSFLKKRIQWQYKHHVFF